ncbi:hypothetical protein K438DRAFT_1979846 [Mycena galopus ATCC 62051]|nr:hypothetical protein K438DRAFT_1979846 [Mycena galopus ATCC 62051]
MAPQKHPKLRRALKLPFHGRAATTASGRNAFAPRAGEQPIVYLRTPVAKKTLNPGYAPKDATWDCSIYASIADKLGVVELVVWDKDVKDSLQSQYTVERQTSEESTAVLRAYPRASQRVPEYRQTLTKDMLRKDYLGEARIAVEDWFTDSRPKAWDAPGSVVCLISIFSRIPTYPFAPLPFFHPLPPSPSTTGHAADVDSLCLISLHFAHTMARNQQNSAVNAFCFREAQEPKLGLGTGGDRQPRMASVYRKLRKSQNFRSTSKRGKAVKSKTMKAREVKDVSNSKSKPKPKSEQKADEEKEEAEGKRREMRLGAAMIDSVMLDF